MFQPTNQFLPGSPEAVALADANARRLLILDDGMDVDDCGDNPDPVPYLGPPPPDVIRAGDDVSSLVGVLDYGKINSGGPCWEPGTFNRDYRLHPVLDPVFSPANPRTAAPDDVGGALKVPASMSSTTSRRSTPRMTSVALRAIRSAVARTAPVSSRASVTRSLRQCALSTPTSSG
jgi:predicted extracellular nuclease